MTADPLAAAEVAEHIPSWGSGSAARLLFAIAVAFSILRRRTAAHSPLPSQVVRSVHVGLLMLLFFGLVANAAGTSARRALWWGLAVLGFATGFSRLLLYFGILADLIPPVALAAFAAAPIARESGMKIGLQALRIAAAGFVVPFMAVHSPSIMLQEGGACGSDRLLAGGRIHGLKGRRRDRPLGPLPRSDGHCARWPLESGSGPSSLSLTHLSRIGPATAFGSARLRHRPASPEPGLPAPP